VPAFSLVDQTGARFDQASLAGKPWVADFIFSTCTQTCPRLTARMKEVRDRVAKKRGDGAVRFVSFSVDPETDTPPVLAAYAARAGASWSFVTGASDDVQKAVVQGFKVTMQKTVNAAGERDVLHGNWFVLGDGQGRIRGYYQTDTEDDVDKIAHDVLRLVAESAK